MSNELEQLFLSETNQYKDCKFLLAVSMVLAKLFLSNKLNFSIAHCNFHLRGKESDNDEIFISKWCSENNIELFVKKFTTEDYCKNNKMTIQMGARKLRYEWFGELIKKEKHDFFGTYLMDTLKMKIKLMSNIKRSLCKKNKMNDDIKIIFMSSIKLETNEEEFLFWKTHKEKILSNFAILDDKYFWQNNLANKNLFQINRFYRISKSLLRFEIVTYLKKIYDKKFVLIGEDWRKYSIDSLKSNYDTKRNKKIYKGNICLDTGSLEGSSSLYPRANQIIESGGLIVQSYAFDASEHWKDLKQDLLFKNFDELRNIIDKLINNLELSNILLDKISKHFKNSSISMEETLNRYFSK